MSRHRVESTGTEHHLAHLRLDPSGSVELNPHGYVHQLFGHSWMAGGSFDFLIFFGCTCTDSSLVVPIGGVVRGVGTSVGLSISGMSKAMDYRTFSPKLTVFRLKVCLFASFSDHREISGSIISLV